jgi:hypothetical protein
LELKSNECLPLESKIDQDLFALDLDLLLDYGYLIRHMLQRKKKMKYDEITNQICQIQGTRESVSRRVDFSMSFCSVEGEAEGAAGEAEYLAKSGEFLVFVR